MFVLAFLTLFSVSAAVQGESSEKPEEFQEAFRCMITSIFTSMAESKMMAKRHPFHDRICVLRVRTAALDIEGGVIADQTASSKYALFMASPAGLRKPDHNEVFVRSWKFPNDQIREWRLGSKVCAELLVPQQLPPD